MHTVVLTGILLVTAVLAGCASGPPPPPYPAFVQTATIPDQFIASLPGIRAKQFGGDPQLRTMSLRIDVPPDWKGTTGGSPGKSLEIFVLAGQLELAGVELGRGGYVYVPPGSLGFNLAAPAGARMLYFIEDVDPASMIRAPVILDSTLVDWQPTDRPGQSVRELRVDPGSGERTWLLRIAAGATLPWQSASIEREGYLVEGRQVQVECVAGAPYEGRYEPGGYFRRPAGTLHGGPETIVEADAIWFLRERAPGIVTTASGCSETAN